MCEVADDVMPGDIYCCVERSQVRPHTCCRELTDTLQATYALVFPKAQQNNAVGATYA
jgi:hypothetical protein